jgi:hypothetical protein
MMLKASRISLNPIVFELLNLELHSFKRCRETGTLG